MECRLLLLILASQVLLAFSCSQLPGWKEWSVRKRFSRAHLILYGLDTGHTQTTDSTTVDFQVYCVLKNTLNITINGGINGTITIEEPQQGQVHVACVDNTGFMTTGSEYIVMLQISPFDSSIFWFHSINMEEGSFAATSRNIRRVKRAKGVTIRNSEDQCHRLNRGKRLKRRNRKYVYHGRNDNYSRWKRVKHRKNPNKKKARRLARRKRYKKYLMKKYLSVNN